VALARRGHTVRILSGAPHWDDAGTDVHLDGDPAIQVERVRATRTYRWLGPIGGFFDRFDNPEARPVIGSVLDRMQPDVVHTQHLLYLSAELIGECRKRGIPVVVMLNDYWFLCHRVRLERRDGALCSGPARGWNCCQCLNTPALVRSHLNPIAVASNLYRYQYLMRRLLQADRILAPSRFLRDMFYRNGVPAGRIRHCDYGTAPPPPEFADLLTARPPHDPVRFGYLGSLMHHKGVHVLIDAFEHMPKGQAELHLFGAAPDPSYEADLRRRARSNDVHWRGSLRHAERWRAFREIDVLVVPSIWYENSPLTIHEALTAKVPVIGSAIGGIPELVENEVSGLIFPAGSVDGLAACLQQVVEDPNCISRWQQRIVRPQPIDAHAIEIEAIYHELCAAPGREARPLPHDG
jgi:glycosyltransferase involved in cell wall biosynthesis